MNLAYSKQEDNMQHKPAIICDFYVHTVKQKD